MAQAIVISYPASSLSARPHSRRKGVAESQQVAAGRVNQSAVFPCGDHLMMLPAGVNLIVCDATGARVTTRGAMWHFLTKQGADCAGGARICQDESRLCRARCQPARRDRTAEAAARPIRYKMSRPPCLEPGTALDSPRPLPSYPFYSSLLPWPLLRCH